MTNLLIKLKLIYLPFLIIALSFICIYSFLNWLFIIQWQLISINEELINLWLPLGLPCIPVLIWVRPRVKLLSLKTSRDNLPFLYYFIAIGAIVAPAIIMQEYLATASGKLTTLQNVSQINTLPVTRYYNIKTHFIDKQHVQVYRRTEVSGKNNEHLTFHIYVACPITRDTLKRTTQAKNQITTAPANAYNFNLTGDKKPLIVIDGKPYLQGNLNLKPEDIAQMSILKGKAATDLYGNKAYYGAILIFTKKVMATINKAKMSLSTMPQVWLGTEYSKTISNNLSDAEKESTFKTFDTDTYREFVNQDLNQFTYLDHIGKNARRKGYLAAIKALNIYDGHEPIILEAKNEPFEARNGKKLGWIFKSFGIGAGIWLIMIAIPKLNRTALKKYNSRGWQADLAAFYKYFAMIRWRNSNITIILIALNLLVFIIMVFAGLGVISFDSQDLYKWGANYGPAVKAGQCWRLVTSMFLHGGLMHLLMNLFGLVYVSIFLQSLLGNIKMAIAYFTCGISAGLVSIWWHTPTIGVGASGAIFGLFGVAIALLTTNKVDARSRKVFLIGFLVFTGINLLFGLTGNIDNAAHIGGFLSGLVMGYVLFFFIEKPKPPAKKRIKLKKEPEVKPNIVE